MSERLALRGAHVTRAACLAHGAGVRVVRFAKRGKYRDNWEYRAYYGWRSVGVRVVWRWMLG